MPVDLNALAGKLAAKGGSYLSQALLGQIPIVGPIVAPMAGDFIKGLVAKQFGVEPTNEAIVQAIDKADPAEVRAKLEAASAEAKAKYDAIARVAEADAKSRSEIAVAEASAQAKVAESNAQATSTVMLAETAANAASPNRWWGRWREMNANEFTVELPVWALMIMYTIIFADEATERALIALQSLIQSYWLLRGSLLGVHLWQGSNERQVAMTGQPVAGIVDSIAQRIKPAAPAAPGTKRFA